jgi:hypothetical protein
MDSLAGRQADKETDVLTSSLCIISSHLVSCQKKHILSPLCASLRQRFHGELRSKIQQLCPATHTAAAASSIHSVTPLRFVLHRSKAHVRAQLYLMQQCHCVGDSFATTVSLCQGSAAIFSFFNFSRIFGMDSQSTPSPWG